MMENKGNKLDFLFPILFLGGLAAFVMWYQKKTDPKIRIAAQCDRIWEEARYARELGAEVPRTNLHFLAANAPSYDFFMRHCMQELEYQLQQKQQP